MFQPEVIFEDKDVIVIDKPHGMYVIPDRQMLQKGQTVKDWLETRGGGLIVHRLDAGTGGVLILAKHKRAHKLLNNQFEIGEVKKTYLALVKGQMTAAVTTTLPISAVVMRGRYRINFTSGKNAVTSFYPLVVGKDATLVQVETQTGRTHQIRVHAKALGHPLYHDGLYGDPTDDKLLTLFACKVVFRGVSRNKPVEVSANLSPFMMDMMKKSGVDCNFRLLSWE